MFNFRLAVFALPIVVLALASCGGAQESIDDADKSTDAATLNSSIDLQPKFDYLDRDGEIITDRKTDEQ